MLIELAETRLDFFEVVREALDLRGHSVQPRAGVRLHVLDRLLQRAHCAVEFAHGVGGLFDECLLDSMILGDLVGEILLALEERGNVPLELNDLASNRQSRTWADQASRERAEKHGGSDVKYVTHAHFRTSTTTDGLRIKG